MRSTGPTTSAASADQSDKAGGGTVVACAEALGKALIEQLRVAGFDGHGLAGVAADEVAVADVRPVAPSTEQDGM